MEALTLHCWVHGEDVGRIVEVKISTTETVAALQEAIKNKAQVDLAAHTLALYKPKDPLPRPYKENLSKFILSQHGKLLEMGDDELSEVFPTPPPKRHIHIIVGM
ncbi:hypothetical protein HD554DRAFT_2029191 [Boletus coccyginus]|nr:hypothetical protein HD554DRAFT_2029191 [Boletus coccyginus]